MPKNRSARDRMMLPGTIDRITVSTLRGQYQVKKWPKKRGKTKDPIQQQRVDRFANANRLAKYIQGPWWVKAHKITKGTGLYPRDILVRSMMSGYADIVLADGNIVTQKQWLLEAAVFQGVTLQRTSNFAVGASTETAIPWQDPYIQTWPMWSASQPTRITIPTGVAMVRLTASIRSLASVTSPHFVIIRDQSSNIVAAQAVGYTGTVNDAVTTPVIRVVPGNWFDCRVFWGAAGSVQATTQSRFSCEILQTT